MIIGREIFMKKILIYNQNNKFNNKVYKWMQKCMYGYN